PTLLWPLLSRYGRRTPALISFSAGVTTGTTLDATSTRLHRTGSANGVSTRLHQTLFRGSAFPRCPRYDCEGSLRARETHPYPHQGVSKRRDHTLRRSQLGSRSWGGHRGAVGQQHSFQILPVARTHAGGKSKRAGRGRWRQPTARARGPEMVLTSPGRSPHACPSSAVGSPARAGRSAPARV